MPKQHDNKLYYLIDHLAKTIELPDFIERETDIILKWRRVQQSAACHCPMPNHNDRNASFHLNLRDGVWIYHCLAGDTKVLTWEGVRSIKELDGTTHKILTDGGKWVEAPFKYFGRQMVSKITLSRNGQKKIIKATSDHRWFVRVKKSKIEKKTKELKVGDTLSWVFPQNKIKQIEALSPQGITHGIVFGDGTLTTTMSIVNLWGEKNIQLLKWFNLNRTTEIESMNKMEGIQIQNMPFYYKEKPSIDESPSYLAGWLAGWLAADGHVSKDGTVLLNSANKENLEFARLVAMRLGIGTYGITCQNRLGIDKKMSNIYRIHFITEDLNEKFFLIEEHRLRFLKSNKKWIRRAWAVESIEKDIIKEDVYCATVEGTHSFALEDNILTGNCFGCGSKGHIVHFCMDYFGLRNKYESILFICKKFNIKDKEDLILQGLKNVSKKVDVQRKIENLNIMVSNQCRMLLRSNLDLHKDWVFGTYKKLDEAMEKDDCELVEAVGYEASNRMNGVLETV